ncbi:tetratricopeptide repeat protein [Pontibacter russatus]|uniref:tetratricopeptide repeat protein n=1 Tax=Pontibacter russatus TaxID=2694929 RepID=UPI00137A5243|nr:tetratricopeptide repeat protein [Pontibacter russatus]
MAKPHPFFLLLCLLSFATGASALPAFTPQLTNAYQELLNLKVSSSRALLRQAAKDEKAGQAVVLLLANYNDFLELCVEQDPERYDQLVEAQEQRLEKISRLPGNSAWKDYAAAEVRMQLAICKLLFGNRLSAAWDFRKAYLQYAANASRWPDFIPNRKNLGVLQVLIGSVPDQYQWFLEIIGLSGSVQEGMANLRAAATQPNPFRQEAKLLHALMLHSQEQEAARQAIAQVTDMAKAQPDNLLFLFTAMHLLKKTHQGEAALKLYEQRPMGKSYLNFPYLNHMAADLFLYRGDYEESIEENNSFLQRHKGKHYRKAAHYKLYIAYLLGNHPPQAKWHFIQIAEAGIAETEEDKYAAAYAARHEQPVLPLLKARLHADGGYYREALKDLGQLQLTAATPLPVRAEFLYRKARVYHGLEDLEEAASFYQQTIATAASSNLYFAPNATLQLGYIYRQANQPEKAKAYFRQALRYKGHPYKNSIDAKAKLALSYF